MGVLIKSFTHSFLSCQRKLISSLHSEKKWVSACADMLGYKQFGHFHYYPIVLLMILLSSCSSHVSRKDGPPNFYVDETKIPNAVPKAEPLAKYGNMNSYRVFGKRYYTMTTSKNYDQVGIASWYGTKFHSQRTSSGERYNMLAMTAAHKTLPLPTYVEVTNLANQRKVIVKVNDRGPFAENRIIDLSYIAAKKLGVVGHGTARVRVKAIDPNHYGNNAPLFLANKSQHSKFAKHVPAEYRTYQSFWKKENGQQAVYLQVGAFKNRLNAEKLKQHLVSQFEAPIKISHNTNRHSLYRVQIGPIHDMQTANKISHRLKILKIKANKSYGV